MNLGMPRSHYEPVVKTRSPKRKQRNQSQDLSPPVAETTNMSNMIDEYRGVSCSPRATFDEDELRELLVKWPNFPREEHDSILQGVLESAVSQVGFQDDSIETIYIFLINEIPIRDAKTQASAFVAFCSCQAAKRFAIGEIILKSLIRSLRLALTTQLNSDDILFLANRIEEYPPQFVALIEQLSIENHNVRIDNIRIPDDANILETASQIVPKGFKSAEDLLENVHRIDVNCRESIRQVKMILNYIFLFRRDLVKSNGHAVAAVIQKIEFCPESCVGVVKSLARASLQSMASENKNLSLYALALIFVKYLDVISSRVVAELPEIISLISNTLIPGSRMLKDILETFKEVYRNSIYSKERVFIQNLIMDRVIAIIRGADSYEQQLDIVQFLEELEDKATPSLVYSSLCLKAEGLGIINRVCHLLLNLNGSGTDKTIQKAIRDQVDRRSLKLNEIKIEHPHLYRYMHA